MPWEMPRPDAPKAQIEFDLRAWLETLNSLSKENAEHDFDVANGIVSGRLGFFGTSEWRSYFVDERGETYYHFDKIEVETLEKDAARVKFFYSLLRPNQVLPEEREPTDQPLVFFKQIETMDLRFGVAPYYESPRWRIVPPSYEESRELGWLELQHIACYGSQRAGMLSRLRAEISIFRLKMLWLGVVQFVQDYDERYAFAPEFLQEALMPYVKSKELFFVPGTLETYSFNANLSDKSLAAVNEAAQTVLFYEGEDEKPVFRYDGRAAIGFTDGHVKLISPEEAKTLIWKP